MDSNEYISFDSFFETPIHNAQIDATDTEVVADKLVRKMGSARPAVREIPK